MGENDKIVLIGDIIGSKQLDSTERARIQASRLGLTFQDDGASAKIIIKNGGIAVACIADYPGKYCMVHLACIPDIVLASDDRPETICGEYLQKPVAGFDDAPTGTRCNFQPNSQYRGESVSEGTADGKRIRYDGSTAGGTNFAVWRINGDERDEYRSEI